MLEEKPVAQADDATRRRWFADDDLDLIVWFDPRDSIRGFQLCYDRGGVERALTWTTGQGYFHNRVDGGEMSPLKNQAPILVADGRFDGAAVSRDFRSRSEAVPAGIRTFVLKKLENYPS